MSRSSADPPFPCPPGMAWDGRRFYKLDPKLAKIRESPAPRRPPSFSGSPAPVSPHCESARTAVPPSAFHFTPANPPAAFGCAQSGSVYAVPRSGPPCSAASRAYKRARIQRHHASLRSHSRNFLPSTIETPRWTWPSEASGEWRAIGKPLDFHSEGSLVWVEYADGEGREEVVPIFVDPASRAQGTARFARVPRPLELERDRPARDPECYRFAGEAVWATPSSATDESAARSHVAATIIAHAKRGANDLIECDTQLYALAPERAKAHVKAAASALLPQKAFSKQGKAPGADHGTPFMTFLTFSENDHGRIAQMLGTQERNRYDRGYSERLPRCCGSTNKYFTAAAINDETGFCWLGFRSGSIQVLDAVRFLEEQPTWPDPPSQRASSRWYQAPHHGLEGAVTDLVAVGSNEVVALFSKGGMALLHANKAGPSSIDMRTVRTYTGHVNEGDLDIPVCVEPDARLIAARGIDGYIRIWHLDNPFPINGAWHQPRKDPSLGDSEAQNLLPTEDNLVIRLRNRSKPGAGRGDSMPDTSEYSRLLRRPTSAAEAQGRALTVRTSSPPARAASTPSVDLSTLRVKRSARMAFGLPAWVADGDVLSQWSTDLEELRKRSAVAVDSPLFSRRGALPSLIVADSDEADASPTIIYFESRTAPS